MKKTLVLGASPDPVRFSNKMIKSLVRHGIDAVPLGIRKGEICGLEIISGKPDLKDIHTVSLYLNPEKQKEYLEYLIQLNPERIIFNPGTHNPVLEKLAGENDIKCVFDCALIMISKGNY